MGCGGLVGALLQTQTPMLDDVALDALSPTEVPDEGEQVRLALRAKCLGSTFFFAKFILGFKDMTVATHGPMCRFIESPSKRKVGMAPRDHLKTSVWTIADTARRICADPNIRILIGNETATNAAHFVRRIAAIWERNPRFAWLFPELIPDWAKVKKWSETELLVPRTEDYPESTLEAIGVGGAVVSRHFNLIKLDDLVGKEASESDLVMQKTVDWWIYCESLLVDPNQSELQTYGTRWAYHDVLSFALENEEGAEKFRKSAIQEDGTALWPERFDRKTLDRIKRKYGSWKFSCQYLNDPIPEAGGSFDEKWLKFYVVSKEGKLVPEGGGGAVGLAELRIIARVDPAITEEDAGCESAICVDGVDKTGRKFLLEEWATHAAPSELISKIFEIHNRWRPQVWGIEGVAFQRFLKFAIEDEAFRRSIYLNVVMLPLKGSDTKKSKPARIRSLQPYFERGEVFFLRTHRKMLEQYRGFPALRENDLLDAFAYGPQMWETPLEDVDEEELETRHVEQERWQAGRSIITGY